MTITVENERFCPSVVTDEVNLPSLTIPFSVPTIIDVTEGGLDIESSGGGALPTGRVIDDSGTCSEVVGV